MSLAVRVGRASFYAVVHASSQGGVVLPARMRFSICRRHVAGDVRAGRQDRAPERSHSRRCAKRIRATRLQPLLTGVGQANVSTNSTTGLSRRSHAQACHPRRHPPEFDEVAPYLCLWSRREIRLGVTCHKDWTTLCQKLGTTLGLSGTAANSLLSSSDCGNVGNPKGCPSNV